MSSTFKKYTFLVNIVQPCFPLTICHEGYQYMTNIPITKQVYCKQTTALIGYAVTSFLHKSLQFLKAELRSIIDVNH